jgi:hypothetical protein
MGILSSLLGLGEGKPTQVIPTQIAEPQIAKEIAPFLKDILGKGQALYKQRMDEGFTPYAGQTLADVSADQLAAQEAIRGLVGTQVPGFAEARDLVRKQVTDKPTAEALEPYMSPYQQAVVDIEKRKAEEQFERDILPKVRQAQIGAGAFGGTRGTMLEAQALSDQARLQSDIQARGSQQAYRDAQQAFQQQKQREAMAAQGLTGLTTGEYSARLGEVRPVEAIGRETQQREQALLDEAYKRFLQERGFPEQQLGKYQSIVSQVPIQTGSVTYSPQQFQPSPIAQALGVGTGIANIYGAFSNPSTYNPIQSSKEGGLIERAGGGGLASLPVVRRQDAGLVGAYPTDEELDAERAEVAKFKERERYRKALEEVRKSEGERTRDRTLGISGSETTDEQTEVPGGTGGQTIDPVTLLMQRLALSPDLFKTTDPTAILEQMEKTQEARATRSAEELGTRTDLLNQAKQQAAYNKRQAVLAGLTKGLLSPTVGGTGIGMGVRQAMLGATEQLEKVPDQSEKLLQMQADILDKKSASVYQAEKDKLDLMVTTGQMTTAERAQRLANITALATLQNSIKSGQLADFTSIQSILQTMTGLPGDVASSFKSIIKDLPLPSKQIGIILEQIDLLNKNYSGTSDSDIAKDSVAIEGE